MKRELLFVTHHLTVGGVQKSLVSALSAIDYDKYNVTLYVRKNRLDIIDYIDKRVNVVVNKIDKHYYRDWTVIKCLTQIKLYSFFKNEQKKNEANNRLQKYIINKQMTDERNCYFIDKSFDIAIAYLQSITALFVEKYVDAKKKIVFYQGSTDEWHDINSNTLPKFNKIVVEHKDIKNLLLQWYERARSEQVVILENYTNNELLKKQSKEFSVITYKDRLTLCTCSRFSEVKGIDLAVEAAKTLKNKGYRFLWYLVGDGSEKNKIDALIAKYSLKDYIVLPGMQKNPYPYMANCDIYVQPSREEALSIAMLESQMLCVPMISTKTAGGLAMIQEGVNGLLAEINAESLAVSIEKLFINEDLRLSIKMFLSSVDYSKEEARYRKDWELLLES